MKKVAIFAALILLCLAFIQLPVEAAENWVYIGRHYGSDLFYDANSVKVKTDKKFFCVTAKLVYSYEARQSELSYAKKKGYYKPEMEKLSYLVEYLDYDYAQGKYFLVEWSYYAADGKEIYWSFGPDGWYAVNDPPGYEYQQVYQKVKRDFNIY